MADAYANYKSVKSLTDVEDETGVIMWIEGENYKVFEILKSDRLAEIGSETGDRHLIELDDEDFEFIEEESE